MPSKAKKLTIVDLHLNDINGMNAGIRKMIAALIAQIAASGNRKHKAP